MNTNASAVARFLKKAGFTTSHLRTREGIRVKLGGTSVSVSADFDTEAEAFACADAIEAALTAGGYTVQRAPRSHRMRVTR